MAALPDKRAQEESLDLSTLRLCCANTWHDRQQLVRLAIVRCHCCLLLLAVFTHCTHAMNHPTTAQRPTPLIEMQQRPQKFGFRKMKPSKPNPGLILAYRLGDEMYRQRRRSLMTSSATVWRGGLQLPLPHDTSSATAWRGLFGLLRRSPLPRRDPGLITQGQKHLHSGSRLRLVNLQHAQGSQQGHA